MSPHRHPLVIAAVVAALANLAGCASAPPKPLRGEFAAIVPTQAAGNGQIGDQIRWGGRIISVQPSPQETCIELLARELSSSAKPTGNPDHSQGRFLACRNGFYDPAIFTNERDVTVTGRIVAYETRQIGEYAYRYPRVAADVIYLWPEQTEPRAYYADPFWPMHYGAWGWGYPYRTVIVRPAPKSETPPAK